MNKNQIAWSVRGVTREARKQARDAARALHVTTGEWVSAALVTVAESELAVSPDSLPPIGPSPIASSVNDQTLKNMDARERALLALASKRPAPKSNAEQQQQSPWSIRGVSQLARTKAAQVAAHRRVTIGEWVNHSIMVHANRQAGIEPSAARGSIKSHYTDVPEKTMRLVETLARHFDQTRSSDPIEAPDQPKTITPDTIREVENVAPATGISAAAQSASSQAAANSTEQKISELAFQVLGSERRNEQRLTALTEVLNTLAERLKHSEGKIPAESQQGTGKASDTLSKAEMIYWESIKDSNDPDAYKSYLERFPDGLFTSLAKRRSSRETVEHPDEAPSIAVVPNVPGGAAPAPPRERRPLSVSSVPKFNYDTLNERAIENTKRKN